MRQGTEIEAFYNPANKFGCGGEKIVGNFTVAGARMSVNGNVVFMVRRADGDLQRIPCEDVRLVDGMDPLRMACSTNLTLSGEDVPAGKRRGRPPRKRHPIDG